MTPWPGKNFIRVYLRRNPDLYGKTSDSLSVVILNVHKCVMFWMFDVFSGPFWICTTLVFAIAISGNISNFLTNLGKPNYRYTPEFRKGEFVVVVVGCFCLSGFECPS